VCCVATLDDATAPAIRGGPHQQVRSGGPLGCAYGTNVKCLVLIATNCFPSVAHR